MEDHANLVLSIVAAAAVINAAIYVVQHLANNESVSISDTIKAFLIGGAISWASILAIGYSANATAPVAHATPMPAMATASNGFPVWPGLPTW